MDEIKRTYWQQASDIEKKHAALTIGAWPSLSAQFCWLADDVIVVLDDGYNMQKRFAAVLSANRLERTLATGRHEFGPMSEDETTDFERLRNALRYAESVFAESL